MAKQKPQRPVYKPQSQVRRQAPARPKPASSAFVVPPVKGGVAAGMLAAVLGVVLYLNTLGHDFTLDDFGAIKENWVVKGGLKNIGILFSTEYRYGSWGSVGSLYRPIPLTMFAAEYSIAQGSPFLHHLINVLLYGLTGWVLWVTWRRILVDYPPAMTAMAVLLFMAHPIHTEVVANIKSRDEIFALLCCTWAMYAIWKHLDTRKTSWLIWALVSYAAAMFSKESSITFLAIFPLTIWFFTNHSASDNFRVSALMVIPGAIFLLIRHKVLSAQPYQEVYSILDTVVEGAKNSAEYFATAFAMCSRYLQTVLFPHPLVSDMGYPQVKVVSFSDLRAIGGFLAHAGLGVWALMNLKKKHFLSYAILFYLTTFSIFSNVIMKIGTSYGERLMYAPSLGFALAAAWLICRLFKVGDKDDVWQPNGKGVLVWGVAGVLIAAYSLKTVTRNPAWKNSASLYAADLPTSPNCAKLNYHNALEVTKNGMDEKTETVKDTSWIYKGIDAYTRCVELYPEYHDAYGSRGLAWFRLQKWDKALEDYTLALKYRPNDAKVLSNMGFIYFSTNQVDKAEDVYRKAIQYDPRFVDARRNLGAVLAMKKNYAPAIEQWKEALKYETAPKNAILYFYIGSAYKDMGRPGEAAPWFEKAYAINPALRK